MDNENRFGSRNSLTGPSARTSCPDVFAPAWKTSPGRRFANSVQDYDELNRMTDVLFIAQHFTEAALASKFCAIHNTLPASRVDRAMAALRHQFLSVVKRQSEQDQKTLTEWWNNAMMDAQLKVSLESTVKPLADQRRLSDENVLG